MTLSTENGAVKRVAWAIIAANERRERSATHGMEIVAEAAIEASGHAELVEALKAARAVVAHHNPHGSATLTVIDRVIAKHAGEQS